MSQNLKSPATKKTVVKKEAKISTAKPNTLLFVDDDPDILKSIESILANKKITILTATSAKDALSLLDSMHIDIIVTTNLMVGMTGVDLLEQVKQRFPDTIRILTTIKADAYMELDAINRCELFHIIIKPWKDSVFVKAIEDAVKRCSIATTLKQADEATLLNIARAIEAKDPCAKGHCERVAQYALLIADALKLPEETKQDIMYGSWLHDCGNVDMPAAILNYDGVLSEDQFKIIKLHPRWGADIARQAQFSDTIINIILYHHERYDGKGYPTESKADGIPIEARIVAIAEVYDAITSDRPYQKSFSPEKALSIMGKMKGNYFDPEILKTFVSVINR
jgi:response regulator RpfG family c-di-GMP phosphodiesterase